MKVVCKKILAEFAAPGRCEYCDKWCDRREGHHIFATGMGGASRLDIRINLVSLGSTLDFQCECHTRFHQSGGRKMRDEFLEIVARREGVSVESIVDEIHLLLRTVEKCKSPKKPKKNRIPKQRAAPWRCEGCGRQRSNGGIIYRGRRYDRACLRKVFEAAARRLND